MNEVAILNGKLSGYELAYKLSEALADDSIRDAADRRKVTQKIVRGVIDNNLKKFSDSGDYENVIKAMLDTFNEAYDQLNDIRTAKVTERGIPVLGNRGGQHRDQGDIPVLGNLGRHRDQS